MCDNSISFLGFVPYVQAHMYHNHYQHIVFSYLTCHGWKIRGNLDQYNKCLLNSTTWALGIEIANGHAHIYVLQFEWYQ